jgi:predicted small secreted protein
MRLWLIFAALAALAACNTIDGVGRDISAGAAALDDAF